MKAWILILGIASGKHQELVQFQRIEVATEQECLRGAAQWRNPEFDPNETDVHVFASCAGEQP